MKHLKNTLEHTGKRKEEFCFLTLHMVKVHVRRNDMTGTLMDFIISQFFSCTSLTTNDVPV